MATKFVIPAIFEAIDKFTAPVRKMANATHVFADKADAAISRNERLFRKLTPALSDVTKEFLSVASAAAIGGAAIAGIGFSADAIMKYEDALASFHVIVGNDKPFQPYIEAVNQVAKETQRSTIDTAAAFEKIAGLNEKFAATADSISAVGKAAILLSKASGDELGQSAESLVGIMNQFSYQANEANKAINILAAGANVGASSIGQTAEAMTTFGGVAAGANISLEQSVGLIQTLGKFSKFGSEAGNELKAAVVNLQKANLGYVNGQWTMNAALEQAREKLMKLKTEQQRNNYLIETFGKTGINTGSILLNNIKVYEEFTKGVTATNAAQEAAEIRTNTLSGRLEELKAAWINMLTGASGTNTVIEKAKDSLKFVAENLETILKVGAGVVGFFVAWKAALLTARVAMVGYNIVLGISNALNGASAFTVMGNTVAYGSFRAAVVASTIAQKALNFVMSLSPMGIAIAATAGLALATYGLVRAYKSMNVAQQVSEDLHERVLDKTIDQRVEVTQLFMALRQAEKGSEAYNETLKKIDSIQPGLVDKYKLQEKALYNISAAEKELTNSIMKRAEEEAKVELLKEAIREKLTLQAEGVGTMSKLFLGEGLANIIHAGDVAKQDQRIAVLSKMIGGGTTGEKPKELATPTTDAQQNISQIMENTNNAKVEITVAAPEGTELKSDNKNVSVVPKVGSTVVRR